VIAEILGCALKSVHPLPTFIAEVIHMNSGIQPVQGPGALPQTEQVAAQPKTQQNGSQNAAPQDKVTISQQAQALAAQNNPGAGR
jgi:hypothetical protein